MDSVTSAQLALELGVSQGEIHDLLRSRSGSVGRGPIRELDEESARAVRVHFATSGASRDPEWALEPGDVVRRREIHNAYGGQRQGGISTPRSIPDVLIFTDPAAGARYGYDIFEGLREDGSYAYTGEGQYGDQTFIRGNRALRDSAVAGKTIRLLRTNGVYATYVGAFTTGDPPYWLETIPDVDGLPRQGIVFSLIPISAQVELLPAYGGQLPPVAPLAGDAARVTPWKPPESSDLVVSEQSSEPAGDRVVSRVEFELQTTFGRWLRREGVPPRRLQLRAGSTVIEPDLYVPEREWIVEAKKSTARSYVRMAIGQVLDYVHIASESGLTASPVVLLPGEPEADLVALMQRHNIIIVIPAAEGFKQLV